MVPLYTDYSCAVPLSRYLAKPEAWFTHTTRPEHFWDRTLDYLFTNGKWKSAETFVGQDLQQESDHAPVGGKLYLVKNK
jgi:endonuclease/exonuclease/phosphatase family metal-dependent hydrolase